MTFSLIRLFFLFLACAVGSQIGMLSNRPFIGAVTALGFAIVLIAAESKLKRVSVRGLSSMVFGLLMGIVLAQLLSQILGFMTLGQEVHNAIRVSLTVVFSYLATVMALRGKDEFNIIIPYVRFKRTDLKEGVVLIDTSALIDGRIADIYKSHFLTGRLVVPRFVLHELQQLADSEDDIKRQRGRRGMELLRSMQEDDTVDIHVHEDDLIGEESVDHKLVVLAKRMDARICTTDFNLSRMATIQGLEMLNINDLVNSVKSVVLAGERIDIQLIKEGKEDNQAIGYLEDGTMIVVSQAKQHIGQTICVEVTSVLQTTAGRMIFAKLPA